MSSLPRVARLPLFLLSSLVATVACTDADLRPLQLEDVFERQRISAHLCAPAATFEDVPYRILFVIDTSLSNKWNDPEGRREAAVRNAITALIDEEMVLFGIITYSDEPRRQTFGFTRDMEILDGATANVGNAQGGTNFSDTLWEVIKFLKDDIDTLSLPEAARTHYLIYWLSDGYPTVGVTEPTALVPAVDYMMDLFEHRVAELQFNTVFLGSDEEAGQEAAEELLQDLASRGYGVFTSIPAGEEFEFSIEREPVLSQYRFAYALVNNTNTRFGPYGPVLDSDGDGVPDVLEERYGLRPYREDSDGDGYRDGVEVELSSRLDPSGYDRGCQVGIEDQDQDGLRDCEEVVFGSLPTVPDSDGDDLLDGIEVAMGTSPVLFDGGFDYDLDNLTNQDEIRFHLTPNLPNTPGELAKWGYTYEVEEYLDADLAAPPCYDIVVDNVTMAETIPVESRTRGVNSIEMVVAFRGVGRVRYFRAQLLGRVLEDYDYWQPADGRFELVQAHFVEFPK